MTDNKKNSAPRHAPRKRAKPKPKDPDSVGAIEPIQGQRATQMPPADVSKAAGNVDNPRTPRRRSLAPTLATIPLHVRWRDLDALNHVNNAAYLTFLEESRMQWLRGVPGEWFKENAVPVMAAVELHYRKPITWPAEIDAQLTCERLGNSSITLGNRIVDRNHPDRVYADGNTVIVWSDPANGAAVPLPQAIRDACAT